MTTDPKRTIAARQVHVFEADGSAPNGIDAQPGDCQGRGDGRLMFACPGCGRWGGITVGNPKPKDSPSWEIAAGGVADVTTLVLRPSINCIGCCGWHGFLGGSDGKRPGVFVSC